MRKWGRQDRVVSVVGVVNVSDEPAWFHIRNQREILEHETNPEPAGNPWATTWSRYLWSSWGNRVNPRKFQVLQSENEKQRHGPGKMLSTEVNIHGLKGNQGD